MRAGTDILCLFLGNENQSQIVGSIEHACQQYQF